MDTNILRRNFLKSAICLPLFFIDNKQDKFLIKGLNYSWTGILDFSSINSLEQIKNFAIINNGGVDCEIYLQLIDNLYYSLPQNIIKDNNKIDIYKKLGNNECIGLIWTDNYKKQPIYLVSGIYII